MNRIAVLVNCESYHKGSEDCIKIRPGIDRLSDTGLSHKNGANIESFTKTSVGDFKNTRVR
jgi:hypothetical protein